MQLRVYMYSAVSIWGLSIIAVCAIGLYCVNK